MTKILLLLVRVYQVCLSPLLGPSCRFYPTCSNFAAEAIARHGAITGVWLTLRRLAKCHPWHAGGVDPVPEYHPAKADASAACSCRHSRHF